MIERLDDIDVQAEEDLLTEELFSRLNGISLIDKYDAFQILDDEWTNTAADIETIHSFGFAAVKSVEPNMVTKKKGDEEFEVQDGVKGTILPFELVQKVKLPNELAAIQAKEDELAAIQSEISELAESFSDEEKETEYEDTAIIDKDKNEFAPKAVKAALKTFKNEYGKDYAFDEDTVEYKIIKASKLLEKEKSLKSDIKNMHKELDDKTVKVIEGLSDEEAKELLEEKWIRPFINNISGLADTVIKGYITGLEGLSKKYEGTLSADNEKISKLESELVEQLSHMKGTEADNKGICELIKLMGGF